MPALYRFLRPSNLYGFDRKNIHWLSLYNININNIELYHCSQTTWVLYTGNNMFLDIHEIVYWDFDSNLDKAYVSSTPTDYGVAGIVSEFSGSKVLIKFAGFGYVKCDQPVNPGNILIANGNIAKAATTADLPIPENRIVGLCLDYDSNYNLAFIHIGNCGGSANKAEVYTSVPSSIFPGTNYKSRVLLCEAYIVFDGVKFIIPPTGKQFVCSNASGFQLSSPNEFNVSINGNVATFYLTASYRKGFAKVDFENSFSLSRVYFNGNNEINLVADPDLNSIINKPFTIKFLGVI